MRRYRPNSGGGRSPAPHAKAPLPSQAASRPCIAHLPGRMLGGDGDYGPYPPARPPLASFERGLMPGCRVEARAAAACSFRQHSPSPVPGSGVWRFPSSPRGSPTDRWLLAGTWGLHCRLVHPACRGLCQPLRVLAHRLAITLRAGDPLRVAIHLARLAATGCLRIGFPQDGNAGVGMPPVKTASAGAWRQAVAQNRLWPNVTAAATVVPGKHAPAQPSRLIPQAGRQPSKLMTGRQDGQHRSDERQGRPGTP